MDGEGTLRRDGVEVPRDEAAPEVAWGTGDLFDDGPMRPFLGLVGRNPSVRWFASPAAGFDHPFFGDLVRKGVRVTTSHVSSPSIAEYVLRAVLDAFQGADQWRRAQAERTWRTHDRHREVAGSTWLVIGLGAIGTEVAHRARALGATVVGVRRSPTGDEPVDEVRTPDRVADVLPRAHAVVLSPPATPATHHLVDAGFLAAMRPGAVLVNVARGDLVDEAALLAAARHGDAGHRRARRRGHRAPPRRVAALDPPRRGRQPPLLGPGPGPLRPGRRRVPRQPGPLPGRRAPRSELTVADLP